jgi:hypothetical protein
MMKIVERIIGVSWFEVTLKVYYIYICEEREVFNVVKTIHVKEC